MLDQGFYTMREAVNLISLDVVGVTASGLRPLFGRTQRYPEAVISKRSYDGRVRDISFFDLIELRFVAHFRLQGVTQQSIRLIAESAREFFGEHPFARQDILFRTDGKRIYSAAANAAGDQRLLDLIDRQYEFDLIEQSLQDGIDWDVRNYAKLWRPRKSDFPLVVVNPRVSFGAPSIADKGISIEAIFDQWRAEGGDAFKVAAWFDLTEDEVDQAIRFQNQLPH